MAKFTKYHRIELRIENKNRPNIQSLLRQKPEVKNAPQLRLNVR